MGEACTSVIPTFVVMASMAVSQSNVSRFS